MTTITLSSKGQVVLPHLLRSQLALKPGTRLLCEIQGNSIILTPHITQKGMREYTIDPLTGLRVTKLSVDSGPVTTTMINTLLQDYP